MGEDRVTWWYCLLHRGVERSDEGCPNDRRLGPYATPAEAELALEKAAARTEAWDAEDEADEER